MWWPDGDCGRGIVCSDLGERDRQKRYGQAAVPLAFLEPTFPTGYIFGKSGDAVLWLWTTERGTLPPGMDPPTLGSKGYSGTEALRSDTGLLLDEPAKKFQG